MLKLRSIFVTSLLTGLVATSNFGCGGSSSNPTDAGDAKPDTKTDGGTGGSDAKPDSGTGETGATDAKDAADTSDASDVKTDATDAADATDTPAEAKPDVGTDADGGTDGDAGEVSMCPTTPVCALTTKRCDPNGGGVETCVTVSGCPGWSAPTACGGHQICTNGACGCVAEPKCAGAGPFCDSGNLGACSADGACLFISTTPAACPAGKVCGGAAGAAACSCATTACGGAASVACLDTHTVRTCAASAAASGCIVPTDASCGLIKTCQNGACVCPAAGTHLGEGCTLQSPQICQGTDILFCFHDDATSCNVWQISDQCDVDASTRGSNPHPADLTCGNGPTGNGPAACQCNAQAASSTTVYVDPVSGSDSVNSPLYPTGVQSPPACRFRSLKQGLSTGAKTVIGFHEGAAAGMPVLFSSDVVFPIVIGDGVTVMSSDKTPANYIIPESSGSVGIQLGAGSVLQGFRVRTDGLTTTAVSILGNGAKLDTVEVVKGSSTPEKGIGISGATVSATLSSVTVTGGATTTGIDIVAAGATISGTSTVSGSLVGIHVGDGTVEATSVVANLNGTGVKVDTAATAIFKAHGGTYSNSGTGPGLSVATGKLFLDQGAQVTGNGADGVDATGGSDLTISGGSGVTGNTGFGVFGTGANSVTIDSGSDISTNSSDGVVGGSSTLSVSGGTTITHNGGNGVKLNGATSAIFGVTVDSNTFNGIDINSPGGVSITIGKAGSKTTLSNNTKAGLLIEKTLQTANHTISTTVVNVDITTNKQEGIFVNPVVTADALYFVQDSRILQNFGTGIRIKAQPGQVTDSGLVRNEVASNGAQTNAATGGVLFEDSSVLSSFLGNNVHHNNGNQVGFLASQKLDLTRSPPLTDQWIISGPPACTDTTKNNTFNGYVPGSTTGVFTSAVTIKVDATYNHWQSGPQAGVDFSSGGGITAGPACP